MNLFEKCAGSLLGKELTWINEPGEWGFHSNQSLAISAPASADFFRDPSGEIVVASAPFLFTKIKGDFILTTKVSVEMKAQYDSGCLMVMADDLNWAKLCFEFFENKPSILSIVTKDTSDDCISG
jgi:regulation of enolase protein 1 (concanavalin A-like superfamily)